MLCTVYLSMAFRYYQTLLSASGLVILGQILILEELFLDFHVPVYVHFRAMIHYLVIKKSIQFIFHRPFLNFLIIVLCLSISVFDMYVYSFATCLRWWHGGTFLSVKHHGRNQYLELLATMFAQIQLRIASGDCYQHLVISEQSKSVVVRDWLVVQWAGMVSTPAKNQRDAKVGHPSLLLRDRIASVFR